MNEFAILSVMAYYMDWNLALWNVQLAFDVIDSKYFSYVKS